MAPRRVEPPVPLEDELHLLSLLKVKGMFPDLAPVIDVEDPIDCIRQMTADIKSRRAECQEDLWKCTLYTTNARGQRPKDSHIDKLFERADKNLGLLADARERRLRVLRHRICGDHLEFRGRRAYTMLQYVYHDLGDDYLLVNKLKVLASQHFNLDEQMVTAIEGNEASKRSAWLERRSFLASELQECDVQAAVAFVNQLDNDPPEYARRSGRVRVRANGTVADSPRLNGSYVPSAWKQILEQARKKERQDQNIDAQSEASSAPNKAKKATDDDNVWEKVKNLDGVEWEGISSDILLDGEEIVVINDNDHEEEEEQAD